MVKEIYFMFAIGSNGCFCDEGTMYKWGHSFIPEVGIDRTASIR